MDVTRSNRRVLVHGDVSPKNILVSPDLTPVFLDALRADGLQVTTCAELDSARFNSLLQTAQVLWHRVV